MPEFKVEAPFEPTGDQPEAIEQLAQGIRDNYKQQTLLGVTGSGKTYTVAKIVEQGQTLLGFLSSIDLDEYLHESIRGHHILAVRLGRHEQMEQVRDLLAPHHAHLMKYIDTWTVAHLLP